MDYNITCKDCIHCIPATRVIDEIHTDMGIKVIEVKDALQPPYCDYIRGTTSRMHEPCRYGFKLRIHDSQDNS